MSEHLASIAVNLIAIVTGITCATVLYEPEEE